MNLKSKRKGFTIVELVIVIAVIGILSAVLIPTFVNLTKKAHVSADVMTVRNINTQLKIEEEENGKPTTFGQMLAAAEKAGYSIEKISPTTNGYSIVWDSEQNMLYLFDKDGKLAQNQQGKPGAKENLWAIADSAAEVKSSEYNTYLSDAGAESVETSHGIEVAGNTNVTFKTTASGNFCVVLNGGVLTIDAPNANVSCYGEKERVDINQIAKSSYHEFGVVSSKINLKAGKVVLEKSAQVEIINVTATAAGNFAIDASQNSSLSLISADNPQLLVTDGANANVKVKNDTKVMTSESQSAEVFSSAVGFTTLAEAFASNQNAEIILLKDLTLTQNTTFMLSNNNNIVFNLNGKTLSVTSPEHRTIFDISNGCNVEFKNGNMKLNNLSDSVCVISVSAVSKLTFNSIDLTSDGTAIYVYGSAALVHVKNSSITSNSYAVGTNASVAENYNVNIVLEHSTLKAAAAVMVNIPCSLTIDDCDIHGSMHGVIVRGGTAVIKNSRIYQEYTDDDAETMFNYFNERNWGSGNTLELGGVIVGNKGDGKSYQYPSNATIENTTITTSRVKDNTYFSAIYVCGNSTTGNEATLNYSNINLVGGKLVIGNEYCIVNGEKQTPTSK